ncbi:MAG: ribosomal-processing cysteine protease Prp [Spirochaetales bacterium]|jgi:uncharacterized protein YsxB (DUF464 family)|nr:ribosomal-processing cysteine protease Prp [Spirochaetales bacterium]
MIQVSAVLDGEGCLRSLSAQGHSFKKRRLLGRFRQGQDFSPACAAVSALLRTAASLFEAEAELEVSVLLPAEGSMELNIGKIPPPLVGRCRGITDFLVCGLAQISEEAPKDLSLRVVHESI